MQNKIKIVNLTLAFIFIATALFAQEEQKENKLIIGLRAGTAGSVWWGNPSFRKEQYVQYQPKLGLITGASVQYNLKPRFALCAEINYERKGNMFIGTNTVDDFGNRGTAKQNEQLDYVTLPISAKFKLNKKKIAFYASTGIYLGYLIKYGWSLSFNGATYQGGDISAMKRFDYGLVTGLGWDVPIKEHFQFSIEIRNNLGLYGLNKGVTYNNERIKNESFAFLFGLAYKLK